MKNTLITAHSGCMNTPPNSIDSVLRGIQVGADIVEMDVRATKDGVAILQHDEKVETPKGNVPVQNLSFDELNGVDGRNKIFKLEEVLPIVKEHNRIINLDVKEDGAVTPMIETVEKHNMRDYVIISGCEMERAHYLKNHHRSYQVLLNASLELYQAYQGDYDSFIKETCRTAIDASCCGININYQLCQESLIEYAMFRCLPVSVWTIDDSKTMEKYFEMGVHSITTNEVKKLVDLKNKRNMKGKMDDHKE